MTKYVYSFGNGTADGDGKMKDTLGGKGAGLAEMCRAKLPVPPGFTISTQVCNIYFDNKFTIPAEIDEMMLDALKKLEGRMGQKLGDPSNPLLVSVRSGAKFSMPGMENLAPLRTLTSSGLETSPSFWPMRPSSFLRASIICSSISAGTVNLLSK